MEVNKTKQTKTKNGRGKGKRAGNRAGGIKGKEGNGGWDLQETKHLELARINKSILKHCSPRTCLSKLKMLHKTRTVNSI